MNPRRRPLRLGLTGGIGSGKSTVGGMFAALGGSLIDADQLARDVTGPQGAAMNAIRATFGADFVDASGALDRARMRALVFSHPEARAQLEGIVHPLVTLHGNAKAQQAAAQGHALIVFDIPLLAESGLPDGWHWSIVGLFSEIKQGLAKAAALHGRSLVSAGGDTRMSMWRWRYWSTVTATGPVDIFRNVYNRSRML